MYKVSYVMLITHNLRLIFYLSSLNMKYEFMRIYTVNVFLSCIAVHYGIAFLNRFSPVYLFPLCSLHCFFIAAVWSFVICFKCAFSSKAFTIQWQSNKHEIDKVHQATQNDRCSEIMPRQPNLSTNMPVYNWNTNQTIITRDVSLHQMKSMWTPVG